MGPAVLKIIRLSFNSNSDRYLTRRERKKSTWPSWWKSQTYQETGQPVQSESPEIQWLRPDSEPFCFFFSLFFCQENRGMGIHKEILAKGFMQQSNLRRKLVLNSDSQQLYSTTYLLVPQFSVESRELSLFIGKCTLTHPFNEAL